MGENLFNFLFSGVLSMVVALLLYRAAGPASAICLAGFLLSILFGIFISYHILYLFAMSAFWVTKPWYIQTLVIALTRLFGGGVIPIWLYPDWLKAVSDVLPFRFITYEPIQIFLGNIQRGDSPLPDDAMDFPDRSCVDRKNHLAQGRKQSLRAGRVRR